MKLTWIEQLRRSEQARYVRLTNWHRHFALLPTWVGEDDCRWLEWIERKCEYASSYDGTYTFAQYRAPQTSPTP